MYKKLLCAALIGLALLTFSHPQPAAAAPGPQTFTVTETGDDDNEGTFRWAVYQSNSNVGYRDTIAFNIPASDPSYQSGGGAHWWKIALGPPINITDEVIIDGTTQTTNRGNVNPYGPEILLTKSGDASNNGLTIAASNVTVKGLCISGFGQNGIYLEGNISNAVISGCYIGTNATGTTALANTLSGIYALTGPDNTLIGGSSEAERNVISGNTESGVYFSSRGEGVDELMNMRTTIIGNYVGTNATGAAALPNGHYGVYLREYTRDSRVGGLNTGERNIISGNTRAGVMVGHLTAYNNTIAGNYVGLNAAGTAAIGNGTHGIAFQASAITVEANVSSGNAVGISFFGVDAYNSTVRGNYVGTDATGVASLPNTIGGIAGWNSASRNVIGPANIVAFNPVGLVLSGEATINNRLTQNSIFQNNGYGIVLLDGANNLLSAPTIESAVFNADETILTVTGVCTPAAIVELFRSDPAGALLLTAEGKTYLGTATADAAGNWSLSLTGAAGGGSVCATGTQIVSRIIRDGAVRPAAGAPVVTYYNTSAFSGSRPVPTTTPTTTTTTTTPSSTTSTVTTTSTTTTTTYPIPDGSVVSRIYPWITGAAAGGSARIDLDFSSKVAGEGFVRVVDNLTGEEYLGWTPVSLKVGSNLVPVTLVNPRAYGKLIIVMLKVPSGDGGFKLYSIKTIVEKK